MNPYVQVQDIPSNPYLDDPERPRNPYVWSWHPYAGLIHPVALQLVQAELAKDIPDPDVPGMHGYNPYRIPKGMPFGGEWAPGPHEPRPHHPHPLHNLAEHALEHLREQHGLSFSVQSTTEPTQEKLRSMMEEMHTRAHTEHAQAQTQAQWALHRHLRDVHGIPRHGDMAQARHDWNNNLNLHEDLHWEDKANTPSHAHEHPFIWTARDFANHAVHLWRHGDFVHSWERLLDAVEAVRGHSIDTHIPEERRAALALLELPPGIAERRLSTLREFIITQEEEAVQTAKDAGIHDFLDAFSRTPAEFLQELQSAEADSRVAIRLEKVWLIPVDFPDRVTRAWKQRAEDLLAIHKSTSTSEAMKAMIGDEWGSVNSFLEHIGVGNFGDGWNRVDRFVGDSAREEWPMIQGEDGRWRQMTEAEHEALLILARQELLGQLKFPPPDMGFGLGHKLRTELDPHTDWLPKLPDLLGKTEGEFQDALEAAAEFIRKAGTGDMNDSGRGAQKQVLAMTLSARLLRDPLAFQAYQTFDPHVHIPFDQWHSEGAIPTPGVEWDAPMSVWRHLEEVASTLIHRWAESAFDTHRESIAMQLAAVLEFGLGKETWDSVLAGMERERLSDQAKWDVFTTFRDRGAFMRRFLRAMHENTQEEFAKFGITEVGLFRGINFSGDVKELIPHPLASWTSLRGTAEDFAGDSNGVVFQHMFDVRQIVGTTRTGFGALPEWEFVALGLPTDQFELARPEDLPPDEQWMDLFTKFGLIAPEPIEFAEHFWDPTLGTFYGLNPTALQEAKSLIQQFWGDWIPEQPSDPLNAQWVGAGWDKETGFDTWQSFLAWQKKTSALEQILWFQGHNLDKDHLFWAERAAKDLKKAEAAVQKAEKEAVQKAKEQAQSVEQKWENSLWFKELGISISELHSMIVWDGEQKVADMLGIPLQNLQAALAFIGHLEHG